IRGYEIASYIFGGQTYGEKNSRGEWKMVSRDSRFVNVPVFVILTIAGLLSALYGAQTSLSTQALIGKLRWRSVRPYIGGRVITVAGVPGNPNLDASKEHERSGQ